MTAADDQLREANWKRMRSALERAATEYRRCADDLDTIHFVSAAGAQRSPDAIISQAALAADPGRIHADLMHRLATWAESINALALHDAGSRVLCPATKTFGDETWSCVLSPGHSGPERKGVLAHMTASGSEFYV